jgi:hypothetical protein
MATSEMVSCGAGVPSTVFANACSTGIDHLSLSRPLRGRTTTTTPPTRSRSAVTRITNEPAHLDVSSSIIDSSSLLGSDG